MPPLKTEETDRSLGDSINVATRSVHARLNKLIIARLPLAIPPHVNDPSNYVSGLLHITPIYATFESLWKSILDSPASTESNATKDDHSCEACKPSSAIHHASGSLDEPHGPAVCSRLQSLLQHLHTTDLERVVSLKKDIAMMTGWSPELLDEQLKSATESPFLSAFVDNIRRSVQERPQVLLAYAWVLYMALFSGGRFMKASLSKLDPSFWTANTMATGSAGHDGLPLNFFTFDAPNDGDEIKLAFKKRLAESESLLTPEEREDVVMEAQRIFEFMVEIVGELDGVCRTDPQEQEQDNDAGIMWRMSRLLGLRARDITKDRQAWTKWLEEQEADDPDSKEDDEDEVDADMLLACWHGGISDDNKHLTFTETNRSDSGSPQPGVDG
ncbi:heme oxygenase [Neopestalotiopsis sp. 37M]|nr:heme oxygenase [Neopestalotiopsis sp. 37M]